MPSTVRAAREPREQRRGREDAGWVSVDGARLRYRIEGSGQPILVIGTAIFYPRIFSDTLREQVQLVFVDLRHFGENDGSFAIDEISIQTYADDIEHVRQTLGLGDIVILGHSVHGCIALEYARRYAEHVRGAVTTGSYPYISDEEPSAADRLWDAEASEERKTLLQRNRAALTPDVRAALSPSERVVRVYGARAPLNWYDPTYNGDWLWEGVTTDVPVYDRLQELFETYDLAQGPGTISVPVLIAQGRYDYNAVYTLWEEHSHKLPRHTYALFGRSAHFPSFEEPDRFDATLLAWVRTVD